MISVSGEEHIYFGEEEIFSTRTFVQPEKCYFTISNGNEDDKTKYQMVVSLNVAY